MDASVHNIDEQEASEETTGIVVPEVDAEVNTATHNASDGNHSSSTVDPVAGVDASQGDAEGDVEVANVHEIKPEQQRHWRQAEMDATVVRLQAQVRRHLANKFIQRKKEENAPSHECVAARDNSAATKIQAMVRRRQLAGKLNLLRELRDLQRLNWWQNVDSTERDEAPLFLAAHHGDLLKIESILEDQSKRANSRKRAGLKPGNIGPNQILLGECPEPRRSGSTPLIEAARAGQVQAMALLLEKKADVRIQNTSGDTALSVAIQQAVESLEGGHGGASPNSAANNQRDPKEQDPKSGSRRGGALDTQAIDFLLSRNANIDKRDGCGRPPIHLAVFSNDVEILQYLLRNKASVNNVDSEEATPLHVAAFKGNVHIAKVLLNHQANPDSLDVDGATPLYYAAAGGHADVVSVLIDAGADIDLREGECDTPYGVATQEQRFKVVEILTECGVDRKASREGPYWEWANGL